MAQISCSCNSSQPVLHAPDRRWNTWARSCAIRELCTLVTVILCSFVINTCNKSVHSENEIFIVDKTLSCFLCYGYNWERIKSNSRKKKISCLRKKQYACVPNIEQAAFLGRDQKSIFISSSQWLFQCPQYELSSPYHRNTDNLIGFPLLSR